MADQELQIHTKGTYKNIYPKGYEKVGDPGLTPSNSFVFEKANFVEGFKNEATAPDGRTYNRYNCAVIYNGEQVSFTLFREDEHQSYIDAGGVGDSVRGTLVLVKDKKGAFRPRLTFAKV